MATGKDLNQVFLKNINEQINKFLKDGKSESEISDNVVDVVGDKTSFVRTEDIDKFKAAYALKNYLEFSSFRLDHTYEIAGVVINEDGEEKRTSLYIREEDITKIADKADEYEKLLGIKLPAQIHQLKTKYANSVLPGTNAKAPRPKLMSETEDAYEAYLESTYASLNIRKEENQDGIGRKPYIHEQIDYSVNDAVNPTYTSEYYLQRFANDRIRSMGASRNNGGARNNRIEDGERLTIRESEEVEKTPLGRKIGSALNSFDTFFKSQSLWRKVRIGAVGGIIGAGAIWIAALNPALLGTAIYGTALIGGTVVLGKKVHKIVKEKLNDWLYGPVKKVDDQPAEREPIVPPTEGAPAPTPTNPVPPANPTPSGGSDPVPPQRPVPPVKPNPTIIPEQLDSFLNEAGINMEQYREIERRVAVAEAELASLTPGTPEHQAKMGEIATLKQQQKEQLLVVEALMEEMLKDFNIQKSGGRNL